jgi:hypothetical protein
MAERPYDRMWDLIGSVRGGPADLSVRTGEAFRRPLAGRRPATNDVRQASPTIPPPPPHQTD